MKRFRDTVQSGKFSLSTERTLKREPSADDINRQVDALDGLVDGIQVADNPWPWSQMSALSAASLLLRRGVDPIAVLSCRDRNRIALQSDLLGLRAMGVTSIVTTRGQMIPKNHPVQATAVLDTTGLELLALANDLNQDPFISPQERFLIGAMARVFRPGDNWKSKSPKAKAKAGARFLQSQLCFNTNIIRRYVEALIREKLTWKYPLIISLAVLPSVETLVWLLKYLPDTKIPVNLAKRFESAADPAREGIRICAELMQEISEIPGVSGVNLMTMGDPASIVEAIKASGLRD